MINSTFLNLFVSYHKNRSPLFTLPSHVSSQSFSLKTSKFSHFFDHIIFSNFSPKIQLQTSIFKKTLKTAIIIDSGDFRVANQKFTIHQEENQGSVDIDKCMFEACSGETGGALKTSLCSIFISNSFFEQNSANIGGVGSFMYCTQFFSKKVEYNLNTAKYIGGIIVDYITEESAASLVNSNFTKNSAEMWSAALRLDRCGGDVVRCFLQNNSALVSGAFFDFSCSPSVRRINYTAFLNNNCTARGTVTCFHLLQISYYNHCVFVGNKCAKGPNSVSIESINSNITITNCLFDGPQEEQIGQRFEYSRFIIANCSWSQSIASCYKKINNFVVFE